MVGVRPYTLFLLSPCAYACGDRDYVRTRPEAEIRRVCPTFLKANV